MDESRRNPSGAGPAPRNLLPPPALCGFLLLLALIGAASHAVGAASGPVAPGMHPPGTSTGGSTGSTGSTGPAGGPDDGHGGGHG
ncbi:hypothetical protein KBZ10_23805 [Streptomyces sp. F63]|uniref:hypothetical protein n=1 Tax=Streptomyces sp. F63 TaxID=2824887 RepID=UPI001B36898D|nr:hypothetical protein [Streptomyces sp. F63]MBQ0987489.1 hypothetical protein [Streptomyces sp. F63]